MSVSLVGNLSMSVTFHLLWPVAPAARLCSALWDATRRHVVVRNTAPQDLAVALLDRHGREVPSGKQTGPNDPAPHVFGADRPAVRTEAIEHDAFPPTDRACAKHVFFLAIGAILLEPRKVLVRVGVTPDAKFRHCRFTHRSVPSRLPLSLPFSFRSFRVCPLFKRKEGRNSETN